MVIQLFLLWLVTQLNWLTLLYATSKLMLRSGHIDLQVILIACIVFLKLLCSIEILSLLENAGKALWGYGTLN